MNNKLKEKQGSKFMRWPYVVSYFILLCGLVISFFITNNVINLYKEQVEVVELKTHEIQSLKSLNKKLSDTNSNLTKDNKELNSQIEDFVKQYEKLKNDYVTLNNSSKNLNKKYDELVNKLK